MSKNQLSENNFQQENVALDYTAFLEAILAELPKTQQLFSFSADEKRLKIDVDKIAMAMTQKSLTHPLLEAEFKARVATINFTPDFGDRLTGYLRRLRGILQEMLQDYLASRNLSLPQLRDMLLADLADWRGDPHLNLSYPFTPINSLTQRRLEIKPGEKGSKSALKLHKLTIVVQDLNSFEASIGGGLRNYLESGALIYEEDDLGELEEIVDQQVSGDSEDLRALKDLIDKEVVGQLKKEAYLKYLEYISENIPASRYPTAIYLQDLIRRLKLLKAYFQRVDVPDDYFKVYYQGVGVDLKFYLARANAWDSLPIIPMVSGFLGETNDFNQSSREFVYGLKLKLNGKVEKAKGKLVFDYNVNLINPESEEHREEFKNEEKRENFIAKVLTRFCLYFFVFASRCLPATDNYKISEELDYDPVAAFTRDWLPILQGSDDQAKTKKLRQFSESLKSDKLQIAYKIRELKTLLKKFLDHATNLSPREYPVHIEVYRGILRQNVEDILNQGSFFKEEVRKKEALRYVAIGDAAINPQALYQIRGKLRIEDIRYHLTEMNQEFKLEYDLTGIKALPVFLSPKEDVVREQYKQYLENNHLVNFPYTYDFPAWQSPAYFRYCFTFFLLCYLCLQILTQSCDTQLFIPIMRLHLQSGSKDKHNTNLEGMMADYSKVLAHILSLDHLANSQGLDVSKMNLYKTKNALNSLYSVIPKNFRFAKVEDTPSLEKLALIVVSSGECDARKGGDRLQRIANLIAEVVTIDLLPDGRVQVKSQKRLSANYPSEMMYRQPGVILDAVTSLYHQGYRHILYIAKTPYLSHLYVNRDEDIFLSQELIRYLYQDYQDLSLYPVFFEQYYVHKLKKDLSQALTLQDTRQLQELLKDPSQKAVVFFNLFNGITVKGDSFYNGVISYATLVGVYQDLLDDQGIRQNLIYNEGKKNDILQYLTLFHFSRYEKTSNHSLKLNPYQNIISEESVAKRSLFKHLQGKADFHLLAFLTEVRRLLLSEEDDRE